MNCSGLLRVCGAGETPGPQCRPNVLGRKPVRLRGANWGAAMMNVWVAQILLAEQLQIPVEIIEYEGTSTDFYASDAAKSYLDAYPYNWDALVRAVTPSFARSLKVTPSVARSRRRRSSRPPGW